MQFRRRKNTLVGALKTNKLSLKNTVSDISNRMNNELEDKTLKIEELKQQSMENVQRISDLQDELKETKKKLSETKESDSGKGMESDVIMGELYHFKGDKIRNMNCKNIPKKKIYCQYCPLLKLFLYADTIKDFRNYKQKRVSVVSIDTDNDVIKKKMPSIMQYKWFIVEGNEENKATSKYFLFGSDSVSIIAEWTKKMRCSAEIN